MQPRGSAAPSGMLPKTPSIHRSLLSLQFYRPPAVPVAARPGARGAPVPPGTPRGSSLTSQQPAFVALGFQFAFIFMFVRRISILSCICCLSEPGWFLLTSLPCPWLLSTDRQLLPALQPPFCCLHFSLPAPAAFGWGILMPGGAELCSWGFPTLLRPWGSFQVPEHRGSRLLQGPQNLDLCLWTPSCPQGSALCFAAPPLPACCDARGLYFVLFLQRAALAPVRAALPQHGQRAPPHTKVLAFLPALHVPNPWCRQAGTPLVMVPAEPGVGEGLPWGAGQAAGRCPSSTGLGSLGALVPPLSSLSTALPLFHPVPPPAVC